MRHCLNCSNLSCSLSFMPIFGSSKLGCPSEQDEAADDVEDDDDDEGDADEVE